MSEPSPRRNAQASDANSNAEQGSRDANPADGNTPVARSGRDANTSQSSSNAEVRREENPNEGNSYNPRLSQPELASVAPVAVVAAPAAAENFNGESHGPVNPPGGLQAPVEGQAVVVPAAATAEPQLLEQPATVGIGTPVTPASEPSLMEQPSTVSVVTPATQTYEPQHFSQPALAGAGDGFLAAPRTSNGSHSYTPDMSYGTDPSQAQPGQTDRGNGKLSEVQMVNAGSQTDEAALIRRDN